MGKFSDKYNALHAKIVAKFGDEKTAKVEKVIFALLIIIFLYILITFLLPLVPFVILGLVLYWYFTVYKKKGRKDPASTADVQAVVVQSAVQTAAKNPELAIAVVKATAGATMAPTPPPESKLPEPWTQMNDPGSGKPYYYNTQTGETQWTVPK